MWTTVYLLRVVANNCFNTFTILINSKLVSSSESITYLNSVYQIHFFFALYFNVYLYLTGLSESMALKRNYSKSREEYFKDCINSMFPVVG